MIGSGSSEIVINVNRLELIEILKRNREAHINDYNEAINNFWILAERELQKLFKETKKKIVEKLCKPSEVVCFFKPTVPCSYEAEYNDAIEMLELSVDETIKLDHQAFKRYVKDEWEWKQSFSATASFYKGVA